MSRLFLREVVENTIQELKEGCEIRKDADIQYVCYSDKVKIRLPVYHKVAWKEDRLSQEELETIYDTFIVKYLTKEQFIESVKEIIGKHNFDI